jgi:4'-phosphopantetheinyl transferase
MLQVYLASSEIRLSEEMEREYMSGMPESMRTAIQRYRRWEDRQATLFGKLLLQHVLRCQTVDQGSLCLERLEQTDKGKPFIRGGPGFNISHSGGLVALALVDAGTVGIDVEKIRPIQIEEFSRYLPEISECGACDTSEGLNRFYACWTQKEAVLKAEGSGLLAPLAEAHLQDDKAFFLAQVWHLQKIDCGAAYSCHAATSVLQVGCRIEVINF